MRSTGSRLTLAAFLAVVALLVVIGLERRVPPPTYLPQAYAQSSGSNMVQGIAYATSSTGNIRPVLVGAQDTSANALSQFLVVDANAGNALLVTSGLNPFKDTETFSGKLTSNGTTAVAIQAGAASKTVYLSTLNAYNVSTTVVHTFDLIDSGGSILGEWTLSAATSVSAGGNLILESPAIYHSSTVGNGLSFKIDAGGAATDVIVTAVTVRK